MNQRERVAEHLKEHHSITSMQAFKEYGITRLSAVIFDLRQDGMDIGTTYEDGVNRYGDKTRYGVYIYGGQNE